MAQKAQVQCARQYFSGKRAFCEGGPFDVSNSPQRSLNERSRVLKASWCFTVLDRTPIISDIDKCYDNLLNVKN